MALHTGLRAQTSRSSKRIYTARQRKRLQWTIIGIVMWTLGILFVLPFAWMLVSSLKRDIDVFSLPVSWIPHPFMWQNYVQVWTGLHPLTTYFGNSIIVAVARMVGELFTASLAAYGFSRLHFKGRDALFVLYLSTLIIPFQLLLVPRFILFEQMGLYDTLWALILPGIFTALGTFLLRQFFMTIPQELSDAARIDGANEWQIYWHVILPLARPALASLAILAFVWSWNDYETPLVMLTSEHNFTIPLGLTSYIDESGGFSPSLIMAGAVSSVIPVIAVFLFMQRQFIQALARSGLKG